VPEGSDGAQRPNPPLEKMTASRRRKARAVCSHQELTDDAYASSPERFRMAISCRRALLRASKQPAYVGAGDQQHKANAPSNSIRPLRVSSLACSIGLTVKSESWKIFGCLDATTFPRLSLGVGLLDGNVLASAWPPR